MVQDDPTKRPSIDEVATRFSVIRQKLGTIKLRSSMGGQTELFGLVRDLAHIFTSAKYVLQGIDLTLPYSRIFSAVSTQGMGRHMVGAVWTCELRCIRCKAP